MVGVKTIKDLMATSRASISTETFFILPGGNWSGEVVRACMYSDPHSTGLAYPKCLPILRTSTTLFNFGTYEWTVDTYQENVQIFIYQETQLKSRDYR